MSQRLKHKSEENFPPYKLFIRSRRFRELMPPALTLSQQRPTWNFVTTQGTDERLTASPTTYHCAPNPLCLVPHYTLVRQPVGGEQRSTYSDASLVWVSNSDTGREEYKVLSPMYREEAEWQAFGFSCIIQSAMLHWEQCLRTVNAISVYVDDANRQKRSTGEAGKGDWEERRERDRKVKK